MHWKIQIVNISITRDIVSHIRGRYDCTPHSTSLHVIAHHTHYTLLYTEQRVYQYQFSINEGSLLSIRLL